MICVETKRNFNSPFTCANPANPRALPFLPAITCTMKSDARVWRLNEVSVTLRLPLGDVDFLKQLAEKANGSRESPQEMSAAAGLRTLATAETAYASTDENLGYTCSLSDLGGTDESEPSPHAAKLIDNALASRMRNGYVFAISGCSGSRVNTFRIAAAPLTPADASAPSAAMNQPSSATPMTDRRPLA